MSKFVAFILSVLLFFNFFGCEALRVKFAKKTGLALMQAVVVNPQYDENGGLLTCQYELHWNGREYEAFGNIIENESVGKLFGLTDMNGSDRVYLTVGEKPEEWLIWAMYQPMGLFLLYKEKNVTAIPDGFVPFETE